MLMLLMLLFLCSFLLLFLFLFLFLLLLLLFSCCVSSSYCFLLACTKALHREKVEKGERCVPGCQEVRCTLAALVAVLVRFFHQCMQMKPLFSLFFCHFCLMCCTCSSSCKGAVAFRSSFLATVAGCSSSYYLRLLANVAIVCYCCPLSTLLLFDRNFSFFLSVEFSCSSFCYTCWCSRAPRGGGGGTRVEDVLCDDAPFDDIVLRILVFLFI